MLSGCVVASVKPNIQTGEEVRAGLVSGLANMIAVADELSKLFLTIDRPSWPVNELSMFDGVTQVLSQITHSELDRQALWAFIYAREKLTFAKRLSDIRMWVQGYKEGQRGVMVSRYVDENPLIFTLLIDATFAAAVWIQPYCSALRLMELDHLCPNLS